MILGKQQTVGYPIGTTVERGPAQTAPAQDIAGGQRSKVFRLLNKKTIRSMATVPSLHTIITNWNGKKWFSTLDLKDGYYQVFVNPSSRDATSFTLPSLGHFRYAKGALGLTGLPATFSTLMDMVLEGIKSTVAMSFLDDVIVAAETFEEMLENLRIVYERFRQANLKLNAKKCEIMRKRIRFLGVYLTEEGVEVDQEKTNAIRKMPYPKTKKQVQRALGGFSWWRNFIQGFAEKAKGLTDTLRGEKFKMTEEAKKSFDRLKEELCNPPVLIFADLSNEMILYTDCSMVAMGGVLGQEKDGQFHAIAYGSKILTPTQQAYPSFKREFLALKHFIELWRTFLLHKPFVCYVDAISICGEGFLKKTTSAVMLRWLLKLSEYEFTIKYRPGSLMELPDLLSRPPTLPEKSEQLFDWYVQNSGLQDKSIKKEDFEEEYIAVIGEESAQMEAEQITCPEEEEEDIGEEVDLQEESCPFTADLPIKKGKQQTEKGNNSKQQRLEELKGTFEEPLAAKKDIAGYWFKAQTSDDDFQLVREWLKPTFTPSRKLANSFTEERRKLWNQRERMYVNKEGIICFKFYATSARKYQALIMVPKGHRIKVMYQYHSTPLAGHMGFTSTLANIRKVYTWPRMSTQVKLYCQNCAVCEINNLKYLKKPRAPLKSFPATRINMMTSIDLVGPFTYRKHKYKYILTIMDRFSRYSAAAPLKTQTSKEIAQQLLSKWIYKMGVPETILSDQGANLHLAEIMKDLYNTLGVNKVRTTAYHPATNGALERRHKDLVNVLKKLTGSHPDDWSDYLDVAIFALNSAICSSTGYAPNELVFSYQVRVPADLVFSVTTTEFYKSGAHHMSESYYKFKDIFDLVRANIQTAMKLQKRTYDRQINFTQYKEGDRVLIYRPIPQNVKEYRKFKNTFIGPFEIKKKISEHNYLVEGVESKKQLVVHFDTMRYLRSLQVPHNTAQLNEINKNLENGKEEEPRETEITTLEEREEEEFDMPASQVPENDEGQTSREPSVEKEAKQNVPEENQTEENHEDTTVVDPGRDQGENDPEQDNQQEESSQEQSDDSEPQEELRRSSRRRQPPTRFEVEQTKYYGPEQ